MINFGCDYSEGAHEEILSALCRTNREQSEVYGDDRYSEEAKQLIREKLECPACEIHFLCGGTQTNIVALSHMLRPHQAVIAAEIGHIGVHETGAIEAAGHKVITVCAEDGKLVPERVLEALDAHADFHMVRPKAIYLSNATEIGTVYRREELAALRNLCDARGLYLYIDGARLASAITSADGDASFADYAKFADAFYIGGTKNGALFGEALVIVNNALKKDIRYTIKQRGALLAKGRLLGVQFGVLFRDGLYERLGAHANRMAGLLKQGLREQGFSFMVDSNTNQQFPILSNEQIARLEKKCVFHRWGDYGADRGVVRFVTSWATEEKDVEALLSFLSE